jgi:hypothetical protein
VTDEEVQNAVMNARSAASTLGTSMAALQALYGGNGEGPCARRAHLVTQFNAVLASGSVPASWASTIATPVFKGGGAKESDVMAYRTISLQSSVSKISFLMLVARMTPVVEGATGNGPGLHELQSGFRAARSCSDHHLLSPPPS